MCLTHEHYHRDTVAWLSPPSSELFAGNSLLRVPLYPPLVSSLSQVLCSLVDSLALLPALWWGGAPPGCGPQREGDPGAPRSLPGPPSVPSSPAAPRRAMCVCSALQLRSQPGPVKCARNLLQCPLLQNPLWDLITQTPPPPPAGPPQGTPHHGLTGACTTD